MHYQPIATSFKTTWVGNCAFLAQPCSNTFGRYLVIPEYMGGNRRGSIVIFERGKWKGCVVLLILTGGGHFETLFFAVKTEVG